MPESNRSKTDEDLESIFDEPTKSSDVASINILCPVCMSRTKVDRTYVDDYLSVKCDGCGMERKIRNPWVSAEKGRDA